MGGEMGSGLNSGSGKYGVCCGDSGVGGGVEITGGAGVQGGRVFSNRIGGKREVGDSQGEGLLGKFWGKNCCWEVGEGIVSTGLEHSSDSGTENNLCQLIRN